VLVNILSNAVKFTEQGSVRVLARQHGDELVVEVRDTGPGIPESDQSVLFQPFRQASIRGSQRTEGVGLGLAISKRLVELQGGRIWVRSTPGDGSTFGFSLPAATRERAAAE
jgi:signal transduction histidine kinase